MKVPRRRWCVETLNNFPLDKEIDSAEAKSLADTNDTSSNDEESFDNDEVFADYEKEK